MIVLGIDTATSMVSAAIVDGDRVLAASESNVDRRHAEDLAPMVDFVVRRAGIGYSDLDAVAVDVGPGLFTGMRVGIATAQAMAHVLSLPLVAVDGLDALVAAAGPGTAAHDVVVPTIDVRRGQVAWALHRRHEDATTVRVAGPSVGTMQDLVIAVTDRGQSCLLVGGYALAHRDELLDALGPRHWSVSFGDPASTHPHARHVASIAHGRLLRGVSPDDDRESVPRAAALYLREADAEINWSTRDRT